MFGTGILSYFSFLRFLVMLNLIIFLLMFSFVMLPIIVVPSASGNITFNQNDGEGLVFNLLLKNRDFLHAFGAQGQNNCVSITPRIAQILNIAINKW